MLTIGIVDDDNVAQLEHTLLDPLQLIGGARQCREHKGGHHVGNRPLGLPHSDRLHQGYAIARSFSKSIVARVALRRRRM